MRIEPAALDGVYLVDVEPHADERGSFARTFCEREFSEAGLPARFPQSNVSRNRVAHTLRGMHYNVAPFGESKLVRCATGAIYDVVVDVRHDSTNYLKWLGVELSADNERALFVPAGFAHGFLTLVDQTDVTYMMGNFYRPDAARGFRWNDPAVGIEWPATPSVMSDADSSYPDLDVFDVRA